MTAHRRSEHRVWLVEEFGHGGIGRYAVDVANLVAPVSDVVVATTDGGPVGGLRATSAVWFPRGAGGPVGKARAALVGLLRAARSVRRGDIAWVHLGMRPSYELPLVATLRACGAVVVATVHNRAPQVRDQDSRLVVAAARRAQHVVVHTDAMQAWAETRRMNVVRLPFPPPDITAEAPAGSADPDERAALGLPTDRIVVALLGYLYPYKGPDVLLRALAAARVQDPDLPVHVLMAGRPWPELDLPALAASLGVDPVVTLRPGWLEESTLAQLLAAADVVALPYRSIDNSGMAALARKRGVPAVASDLPLFRDIYRDAALFARPGDVHDLAAALRLLPSRLPDLRAAARLLPADELAPAYQDFIRAMLAGPGPVTPPAGD
ncbi:MULTISPECIES: glycosyltransferase family 4 protein [unclassified Modestobacter]